jgi:hypothetical protein
MSGIRTQVFPPGKQRRGVRASDPVRRPVDWRLNNPATRATGPALSAHLIREGSGMRSDDEGRRQFSEYFAARREVVRRAAYLMYGDWHWADDLTQAAFIRVAASWHRIRDPEALDGSSGPAWPGPTRRRSGGCGGAASAASPNHPTWPAATTTPRRRDGDPPSR